MLIAQRPTLVEEPVSDFRSRFIIAPLEPGFGYTLGNSLRRTLLSSIPGAAVTSIRIDGVLHEFTTVPGVKEDVTDLILNIKELVVSSEHDEPVVMYLRKQGPGDVTAADIQPPAGVEVHNPELHLATLNAKGKLDVELTVERGRGYVSAVQNKQVGQEIGRIPVDSIYSPGPQGHLQGRGDPCRAAHRLRPLVVDVETKHSMLPRDAMASAGKTLVELFGLARELNVEAEGIDMGPSPTDAALAADLALPIEELELTVRSYNCLKREGIHSVGELVSRSEADLLDIRNFGAKSIDEVKAKLHGMGLALKDSPPGFDPSTRRARLRCDDDDDQGTPRPNSCSRTCRTGGPFGARQPFVPWSGEGSTTREPPRPSPEGSTAMPQPAKGQRMGGSAAHERLMLSNLATQLFQYGAITTTEAKARRLRPVAERLITKARKGDLHNRRQVMRTVKDKDVAHVLLTEIGPRYENRPGGYTRITKLGPRKGDNAPMALIELVEALTVAQTAVGEAEGATKRAAKEGTAKKAAAKKAAPVSTEKAAAPVSTEKPAAKDADARTRRGGHRRGDRGRGDRCG